MILVRRLPTEPELGFNQASTLRAVVVEGPQRISSLATRLGVSQPAMSQMVDRLVDEGWVHRRPVAEDRRAVEVVATPEGAETVSRRRASRGRSLDRLVAQLTEDEQERLRAALPALQRLSQLLP